MADPTITQKFGGPVATTPVTINPPAFSKNDTRSADERWVDQQWRDAAARGLGKEHPGAINKDAGHTA